MSDAVEGGDFQIVEESRAVLVHKHKPTIIEIVPQELDMLEEAQSEASQALAFSTAALGILGGAVLGWASGWAQFGLVLHAIFFCTTAISFVAMLWFGLVWRRRAKRRSRVLERIRAAIRPRADAHPAG